jgi:hypothetical protein
MPRLTPLALGAALAALAFPAPGRAAIPAAERSALVSLYNATGGASWTVKAGWLGNPGSECSWFGVTCNGTGTAVTDLFLSDNGLSSRLPASLGNLASLRTLEMDGNALSGSLPKELGRLANLQSLRLSLNQISGAIPRELGDLRSLQSLVLGSNRLSGGIPVELARLASLQVLGLSRNELTGGVPVQLGQLDDLVYLDLSVNRLSGAIPAELGGLANLVALYLGGNQLSGAIHRDLGFLPALQQLGLEDNQLSGRIPRELGLLSNLQFLDLRSNQLTGTLPPELGNAVSLVGLLLSSNRLEGTIPVELGTLFGLSTLRLDGNRLAGPVPLTFFALSDLSEGSGLDLRGNALATDADPELRAFLDSKQVGGNWVSSQAPAAPLDGASLGNLYDYRNGGFIHWAVEVGAGAPPLTFSTDAGGSGNSDLYVRFGALPTLAQFDALSNGPSNQESISVDAPRQGTYYVSFYARSPYTGVTLRTGGAANVCTPGASTLCLSGGRYRVQASWRTPDGRTGAGQAVSLTGDTGYFWFFNAANVEMVIKVLDACGLNGKYWVFAGGLTDVQTDITVTDTLTGTVKTYRNPQGTAFQPIQDTGAFPTCDKAADEAELAIELDAVTADPCAGGPTTLCLSGGRFEVDVTWKTANGLTGTAQPVSLTADTGYFWFFSPSNVEMVLKVLDACGLNGKFWVFAGGLTDVEATIRVTDTQTGTVRTYTNPKGTAFRPIQDTSAFGTCP